MEVAAETAAEVTAKVVMEVAVEAAVEVVVEVVVEAAIGYQRSAKDCQGLLFLFSCIYRVRKAVKKKGKKY